MIKSNIILVFLVFISMNTFSQSERGIDSMYSIIQQTQLEVTESKDQIDLLQRYVIKIKDSLKNCLNPVSK